MLINKLNKNIFIKTINIDHGFLLIIFPDNTEFTFGNKKSKIKGKIIIKDWNVLKKIFKSGSVGFAEAYMEEKIFSDNISKVLYIMALNRNSNSQIMYGKKLYNYLNFFRHLLKSNNKSGSKSNISYHYDMGNDFYSLWLDKSMTYSSALFDNKKYNLEEAQINKYKNLCKVTNICSNKSILEIGCGWGGFAEFAAKSFGSKVTGITLSKQQAEFAKKRMYNAGLNDLVEIRIIDYRDLKEKFDRIISIEMFEAVGEKYWPIFFEKLKNSLKDNGLIGMQLITIKNELYNNYKYNSDFIQKYIFPGGFLPSVNALNKITLEKGLQIDYKKSLSEDYTKTLSIWRENFLKNWINMPKNNKYNDKFKRMWEYYLAYCEAGFKSNNTDVHQITLNKI